MQRLLFDYGDPHADTLIISIAGIHGNEPAGVKASHFLHDYIQKHQISIQARWIGLLGNIQALKENRRFLHEDLNRIWSEANIGMARQKLSHSPELHELSEIFSILDEVDFSSYSTKVFLDLHTTSGENGIFIVASNFEGSKSLFKDIAMPIVLGLEEKLENTAIRYMQRQGFHSMALEGGLHTASDSVEYLMWGIWKVFKNINIVEHNEIPLFQAIKRKLFEHNEKIPHLLEVDYLHDVVPGDNFVMKPGFKNFDLVKEGQLLAKDKRGPILAKKSGFLLMPLYQKEGNDGFFIINQADQESLS